VIIWSLGNEAGDGPNLFALADTLKKLDLQHRPIHYESRALDRAMDFEGKNLFQKIGIARAAIKWKKGITRYDFSGHMYPSIPHMYHLAKKDTSRPILICEYAHAMGNSTGHFKEYWDLFESHPLMYGGYIWDWADQAIWRTKEKYFAYGGDFGDTINDKDFLLNGIVFPDRRLKPAMHEIKKVQQWVKFIASAKDINEGKILLKNQYADLDLGGKTLRWELLKNGVVDRNGTIQIRSLLPGAMEWINVPCASNMLEQGHRYHLNVELLLSEKTEWAEADHVLASEQFEYALEKVTKGFKKHKNKLALKDKTETLEIEMGSNTLYFNKAMGAIAGWHRNGEQLIAHGPELNLWRAPTSNDVGTGFNPDPRFQWFATRWKKLGLDNLQKQDVQYKLLEHTGSQIVIKVKYVLKGKKAKVKVTNHYRISADGYVDVDIQVKFKKKRKLPRVGVVLTLPKHYTDVSWRGHGLHESYRDRSYASHYGTYALPKDSLTTPYIKPQENGNRYRVDRLQLNENGKQKLSVLGKEFSFSLHPYRLSTLTKAKHTFDLKPDDFDYLYLDLEQNALGSESFMYNYLDKYILEGKRFSFGFRIMTE